VLLTRSPADGDLPRLDGLDLRQVDRQHAAPQLGADLVRRDRLGHAELRQQAATPVSATWAEALALMGQNEPERLRAALLATINEIRVLTAADKTRMAAVQVYFAGGAVRSYLITHRLAGYTSPGHSLRRSVFLLRSSGRPRGGLQLHLAEGSLPFVRDLSNSATKRNLTAQQRVAVAVDQLADVLITAVDHLAGLCASVAS
jgi:hypothetical protein